MDKHTEDMIAMDEEVKVAYMKAFTRLACADGNFDDMERMFIKNLLKLYEIPFSRHEEIMNTTSDKEVLEGVKHITERKVALDLVKELCFLAHASNDFCDEETLFLGKVGQAMGVSLDKIEQISNWVIDKIILEEEAKIVFERV